jgi:hypothetical protein
MRSQHPGLRVFVVVERAPEEVCPAVPAVVDASVCDVDGAIARRLGADGSRPWSFLWSWRNDLLVGRSEPERVEVTLERASADPSRLTLLSAPGVGPDLLEAVRAALGEVDKIDVTSDAATHAAGPDVRLRCTSGESLPKRLVLRIARPSGARSAVLTLELLDMREGCLVHAVSVDWGRGAESAARRAVAKLVGELMRHPLPVVPPPALLEPAPPPRRNARRVPNGSAP